MHRSDFLKSFGVGAAGLILPLSMARQRPVKVYDNYLRGLPYYQFAATGHLLREGDKLLLHREPDNMHDSYALWASNLAGDKLGYIAAYENIVLANMMDAGAGLSAFVSRITTHADYPAQLAIEVYTTLIVPPAPLLSAEAAARRADEANDIYRNG